MEQNCTKNMVNFSRWIYEQLNAGGKAAVSGMVLSAFCSSGALAEWYIGADLVPSNDFYQLNSLSTSELAPEGRFDSYEDGLKVFSGYRTSANFSIELEYKNRLEFGVGSVFDSQELWADQYDSSFEDTSAFLLSGQRNFNIDDGKYFYLRGGLYNWDINTSDLTFSEDQTFDRSGTDLFYSIGASFDFSDTFGVRAEWERFSLDEEEVDLISTELRFNF